VQANDGVQQASKSAKYAADQAEKKIPDPNQAESATKVSSLPSPRISTPLTPGPDASCSYMQRLLNHKDCISVCRCV